jgi:hypothetical protein
MLRRVIDPAAVARGVHRLFPAGSFSAVALPASSVPRIMAAY